MDPCVPSTRHETAGFEIFHELMLNKIRKILLVFSPFDAFIMEQGDSLSSRIVREYRGLNLSHPPRLIGVTCARDALTQVTEKEFDLVITTPQLDDMDCFALSRAIKDIRPDLPIILLAHNIRDIGVMPADASTITIDRFYLWSPNPDFLMALVKNVEDHLNAAWDTKRAMVRVLILIEDSPLYLSYFLPLIYKEVIKQTQAVLDESLNTQHRLLKMQARPKILVAQNYEEAARFYLAYRPYVFGVIADTRFPHHGKLDDRAGVSLLTHIRSHMSDLPLLMLSSETANRMVAEKIPAIFVDKNTPDLQQAIQDFFLLHLGFGAFIFRMPDGRQVDRADSLSSFESKLTQMPDVSLQYHAERNHFFTWIMARSEIKLAALLHREQIRTIAPKDLRDYLITTLHQARKQRQQGIVSQFSPRNYDADIFDFVNIGQGAMGGKALGLAFMAEQLCRNTHLRDHFPEIVIQIPKTLVITTDGFDSFMLHNRLHNHSQQQRDDAWIMEKFLAAQIPDWLVKLLTAFLKHNQVPLSVRSSSILEDAQYKPYAGLYRTYMIPNNSPDFNQRLQHLLIAIKLVYASTFYEGPRAFGRSDYRAGEQGMAVIIQHLAGRQYGDFFYPAISGVAQSYNCYARSPMKPEQGVAHIALGLGKTVVEGELNLRFSPSHPTNLPQFSTIDDILALSQRSFYALRMNNYPPNLNFLQDANLEKREIQATQDDYPIQHLTSTFFPTEHRIRDIQAPGPKVATFAQVLKHAVFPLPNLLHELLIMGRCGMGRDVEIEFAADLAEDNKPATFSFLQIRPMAATCAVFEVRISAQEIKRAFCRSDQVLGHGVNNRISDIVFVRPATFKPDNTRAIAREISRVNAKLQKEKRSYLLIGFGRWGSADPWLGIPVQWQDIAGVGAMIELQSKALAADPSQGTHFFQNITAMDIKYFTVIDDPKLPGAERSFINWKWLHAQPVHQKTDFLQHVRLDRPLIIKVDSRQRLGIMLAES